jgi:DNA-binding response OmpR family regulator
MIHIAGPELDPLECATDPPSSILIVDDDEDQVSLLDYRLQRLGFNTLFARRGNEAVASAKSAHPDLILLDVRLPDVDGLSVCLEITDGAETCDIPVIIVSGVDTPNIVRDSRAAGCQFYVHKPYDPNVLFALIQQSLSDA